MQGFYHHLIFKKSIFKFPFVSDQLERDIKTRYRKCARRFQRTSYMKERSDISRDVHAFVDVIF